MFPEADPSFTCCLFQLLERDEEASRRAAQRVNDAIDALPADLPTSEKLARIEELEEDSAAIAAALIADREHQVWLPVQRNCTGRGMIAVSLCIVVHCLGFSPSIIRKLLSKLPWFPSRHLLTVKWHGNESDSPRAL